MNGVKKYARKRERLTTADFGKVGERQKISKSLYYQWLSAQRDH